MSPKNKSKVETPGVSSVVDKIQPQSCRASVRSKTITRRKANVQISSLKKKKNYALAIKKEIKDAQNDKTIRQRYKESLREENVLQHEKLVLSENSDRDRPCVHIVEFTIYDEKKKLCKLHTGLIESGSKLYISGYLKNIMFSESPELDSESIPIKDGGPILEWYVHGFDGGKQNCVMISTKLGEYNLLRPSDQYLPLMDSLYESVGISKFIIEYLENVCEQNPSYDNLLKEIEKYAIAELGISNMTEDILKKHAKFICKQIYSLNLKDSNEQNLIELPCMKEIIKRFEVKFNKNEKVIPVEKTKKVPKWSKATITPLVQSTFEKIFSAQLATNSHDKKTPASGRCGICEVCQLPDCGRCKACKSMAKFGGSRKSGASCKMKKCVQSQAEGSKPKRKKKIQKKKKKRQNKHKIKSLYSVASLVSKKTIKNIRWIGQPTAKEKNRIYFTKVQIEDFVVEIGDFVMVKRASRGRPPMVMRIFYMWEETTTPKIGYFHGQVFVRSSDTIVGEIGNPREIFLTDRCCLRAQLSAIIRISKVEKKETPPDWFNIGGNNILEEKLEDDGKTFFYRLFYDRFNSRFKDLPIDPWLIMPYKKHKFCPSCHRNGRLLFSMIPLVDSYMEFNSINVPEPYRKEWGMVKWRGFEIKKGDAVFLKPGAFKIQKYCQTTVIKRKPKKFRPPKVDENMFPEFYRKNFRSLRGSNKNTIRPFSVGHIVAIFTLGKGNIIARENIYLIVNILLRPEKISRKTRRKDDLNLLYWTDQVVEVCFMSVRGVCELAYVDNIPKEMSIEEWSSQDFSRFYFKNAYQKKPKKIVPVPKEAKVIGRNRDAKSKGRWKRKGKNTKVEVIPQPEPLKTFDVFAGCGGLTEGLHQSGAIESKWAVEHVEAAASAYKHNNPNCTVYVEDCNVLLKSALAGAVCSAAGQLLPVKGEVELLCGGPPCQGFSGMNRFNSGEYSSFKNSLIATFLSYCDFYRPKYFILENVRNFVTYKKGMVLKLTIHCLLEIGYQCTFAILQAGNYGIPQTRRRVIILAAAPGFQLPIYPKPTHCFNRRTCNLSILIDKKRYTSNIKFRTIGPRKTCTIRDAIDDLPKISNGVMPLEIDYEHQPKTHFQRLSRANNETAKLRDHICKNMSPLVEARISRIPTTRGADWRDLPNIAVTLSDGSELKKLEYRYDDSKKGRSKCGNFRGVCACASGRACSSQDKQDQTLIPWCIPHTANRHNNWAGVYGRLEWSGFFSTTVTDPEPSAKQGRILHPDQNRVVSVRECARSQGFPDSYIFAGTIQDKYRQIGNAVPPPLAAALGREIIKAQKIRMKDINSENQ